MTDAQKIEAYRFALGFFHDGISECDRILSDLESDSQIKPDGKYYTADCIHQYKLQVKELKHKRKMLKRCLKLFNPKN